MNFRVYFILFPDIPSETEPTFEGSLAAEWHFHFTYVYLNDEIRDHFIGYFRHIDIL
jgi:hypothetical protein